MKRWDGIIEFVGVVEANSFSGAAERLGIANSQVSKRIAQLEERLGVRLLNRTTRRLTLTDEGEHYYQHCKRLIEESEQVEMAITSGQSEPRGHLRINLSGSFQERFIVPLLARFMQDNPKLTLSVDFTDQPVDLIEGGYDISVCQGQLEDSSVIARKIGDIRNYLVAHPAYLQQHGTPRTAEDLKEHNCLLGPDRNWYLSNGRETVQLKVAGSWHSDNGAALRAAALTGLGIAQLPFFSVLEDIERGDLVQILEPWNRFEHPVWILYPQSRLLSAKIRLCIDYLLQNLAAMQL
jgi:DNA-binding transcriptional LysR family regulator